MPNALLPARLLAQLRDLPALPDAACRDLPGLWDDALPDEDDEDREHRLRLAVRACRTCPARAGCAALAAAHRPRDLWGVWAAQVHNGPEDLRRAPRGAGAA